jgi:RNA polymerase sigma-70 factor, ECF subfamily
MNMKQDVSVEFALKQQVAMRDQQLVLAAQSGSSAAFAEIRALYAQRLYRRIALITRNGEDAEDALQDTFLHGYLAIRTFEGRSSIYSWLTRIAINSALMVLRRRRARAEVSCDLPGNDREEVLGLKLKDNRPNPEQLYAGNQRYLQLLSAIQRLNPTLREPLEVLMHRECSMDEMARVLDLSVGAVKARLHRARRRLASPKGFRHSLAMNPPSSRRSTVGIEGRHG